MIEWVKLAFGLATPIAPVALIAALIALSSIVDAAQPRSAAQRAAFQRANPCPANQERRGPCPGYVVDHVIPLCAGGHDHPGNMQWQTVEAGKLKDRDEREFCRGDQ